jgi:hypothetical protein
MNHHISGRKMESMRRRSIVITELTDAVSRAHEKDQDITCLEVVSALLVVIDRWLSIEMSDS